MGGLILWTCCKMLRCFNHANCTVDHVTSCQCHRLLRLLPLKTVIITHTQTENFLQLNLHFKIKIDDMQFGFMKGKGTTDAIFMARQMQENFRVKGKKLYFGFVDLEKVFDRVPREVISWAMRKLGV